MKDSQFELWGGNQGAQSAHAQRGSLATGNKVPTGHALAGFLHVPVDLKLDVPFSSEEPLHLAEVVVGDTLTWGREYNFTIDVRPN